MRSAVLAVLGVLLGASNPLGRVDIASTQLAQFAQSELEHEFTAQRNALYTSCPYALGTYSFIELVGIRRIYRVVKPDPEEEAAGVTMRRELTLQPKKARYYWETGRKWLDGPNPPNLHYLADYRGGKWWFVARQQVCARGEPQRKPAPSTIPLK